MKVILSEYQEKQIGKTLDLTGQSLYTGNTAVSYAHHRRWRRAFMRARFTPCVMMTRWRQSVVVYFSLADSEPMRNLDLVTVASRVQNGVVCLIPALAFHEITTQIPHEVHVALQRGAEIPRLNYPPIKLCWFSDKAYSAGVETHKLDGVSERIYSPEKTLADCFKFRNKIGLDKVVEAVRFYRERRSVNVETLMRYAAICRAEKVMRPYLES